MARQKEFVPDEALEQAMLTFWRRGFDGASTADLATAMGIGKRSMYDTFGDKRSLYLASLRRYMQMTETAKEAACTRAGTLRESLLELLAPPAPFVGRPPGCFATLAAADVSDDDTLIRELVAAYFARSKERIRMQVRRFVGGVPENEEAIVSIAWDAAMGYRVRARSGAVVPGEIENLVEFMCAHLWRPSPMVETLDRGDQEGIGRSHHGRA